MIQAEAFKEFERSERLVLVELYHDMWSCTREDTPAGPAVAPAMRFSGVALEEASAALEKEQGRAPTEEELQRRLVEMAQAGAPVQEPVRTSLLFGTIEVKKEGLVHVTYESQGGKVTTALPPGEIKCVSYVDEGLIASRPASESI